MGVLVARWWREEVVMLLLSSRMILAKSVMVLSIVMFDSI